MDGQLYILHRHVLSDYTRV